MSTLGLAVVIMAACGPLVSGPPLVRILIWALSGCVGAQGL